jgi:hypothetical protein
VSDRTFEIFELKSNQTAVFLESVSGLSAARERMDQIAANAAGRYVLASSGNHVVIARTETFKRASAPAPRVSGRPGQESLGSAADLNGTLCNAIGAKAPLPLANRQESVPGISQ